MLIFSLFPISRRNQPGDRTKALEAILPIVETGHKVASDVYCLCGRIYKDMFMSSGFTDHYSRDQACYWYVQFVCLWVRSCKFTLQRGGICLLYLDYSLLLQILFNSFLLYDCCCLYVFAVEPLFCCYFCPLTVRAVAYSINVVFISFLRYGKAFETEPTLHSGINNVVLLMAAGHEFDTSIELRKLGALCLCFVYLKELMTNR